MLLNRIRSATLGVAASLALAAGLVACGSGSEAPLLKGTAATGAPIVGGNVTLTCAEGPQLTTTTNAVGAWQFSIAGQTAPCAVRVTDTSGLSLHAVTARLEVDAVNITPFTDLIVAKVSGQTPSVWFGSLTSQTLNAVTFSSIDAAVTQLRTNLGLSAIDNIHPITTAFTPIKCDSMDDALEAYNTALNGQSLTHTAMLALATKGEDFGAEFRAALNLTYAAHRRDGGNCGGDSTDKNCVERCPANAQWNGQTCQFTSCDEGFNLNNGSCDSICGSDQQYDVLTKACVKKPCALGFEEVNGVCKEIICGSNFVKRGNECILVRCTIEGQVVVNGQCVQSICAPGEQTLVRDGAQICISTNCSSTEKFIRNVGCRPRCQEHFNHNTAGVCVRISCPANQVLTVDGQCSDQCKPGEITQNNRCVCNVTDNLVDGACVQKTCEAGSVLNEKGVCEKVYCDAPSSQVSTSALTKTLLLSPTN